MIFHPSRCTAGSRILSIGSPESLRRNHRRPSHRLSAKEIAAPMLLPASTMTNPHHSPKKKPPPTLKIPPGKRRILQTAKSSGKRSALQGPKFSTRFCVSAIRSTIGKKRESNNNSTNGKQHRKKQRTQRPKIQHQLLCHRDKIDNRKETRKQQQ